MQKEGGEGRQAWRQTRQVNKYVPGCHTRRRQGHTHLYNLLLFLLVRLLGLRRASLLGILGRHGGIGRPGEAGIGGKMAGKTGKKMKTTRQSAPLTAAATPLPKQYIKKTINSLFMTPINLYHVF